ELLPLLCERPRRRRQPLALGERLLERGEPLAREPGARLQILLLAERRPCGRIRFVRGAPELGRVRPARTTPLVVELVPELGQQPLRRLLPNRNALRGVAEREQRVAAAAGEHRLRLAAPGEDVVQLLREPALRAPLDRRDASPLLLGLEPDPCVRGRRLLRRGRGRPGG